MRRESSNRLRFVLEELLPPILRDSFLFRWIASLIWGRHIVALANFRRRAPFVTADEYESLYRSHPRIHDGSDNSEDCILKIVADVRGTSVCDVGCGTGLLLNRVRAERGGELQRLLGVDFVLAATRSHEGIDLVSAKIEALPFADDEFDTVICTHVLEHILDFRAALSELRRVAGKRLIIVVPRERESRYTFNPHLHFFAYSETLLRGLVPIPSNFECLDIGRDIYYREDLTPPE